MTHLYGCQFVFLSLVTTSVVYYRVRNVKFLTLLNIPDAVIISKLSPSIHYALGARLFYILKHVLLASVQRVTLPGSRIWSLTSAMFADVDHHDDSPTALHADAEESLKSSTKIPKEEFILRKRLPRSLPREPNDVYVTRKTPFKVSLHVWKINEWALIFFFCF